MLHRTEEVARMIQLTMYCSGCSAEQPFGQLHGESASCPDVADGECPEWGCAVCGGALFIGLPVREHVSRSAARAA
jgi:hypothetical protein